MIGSTSAKPKTSYTSFAIVRFVPVNGSLHIKVMLPPDDTVGFPILPHSWPSIEIVRLLICAAVKKKNKLN